MLSTRQTALGFASLLLVGVACASGRTSASGAQALIEVAGKIGARWETASPSFVRASSLGRDTKFPATVRPADIDAAIQSHRQVQCIETADVGTIREVAKFIAGLNLQEVSLDPVGLDLRYKVEIVSKGEVDLSFYVSRDFAVLFDGKVLQTQRADWFNALWALAKAEEVYAPLK